MSAILALNPGHDGAVVLLRDGELEFCLEAEKDSHPRHQRASAATLLDGLIKLESVPDLIACGGWADGPFMASYGSGYDGVTLNKSRRRPIRIAGFQTELFESTHERSHLFCSYGMSPFEQGRPVYCLLWEGQTGLFCEIDENLGIREFPTVIPHPGYKYAFLYDLANPNRSHGGWNLAAPGKLMALAGYAKRTLPTALERSVIDQIFETVVPPLTDKATFRSSPYFNCGVTAPRFSELVAHFSDALFDKFLSFARQHLDKRYPLLIGGGCGLNCDWNSRWKDSGLFADVFVPPVTNDAGSAIGTAIEGQYELTGRAKINWEVYCGADFIWDDGDSPGDGHNVDYNHLANCLAAGHIVAWVHGRCEIGPRALGHRSLLAAPFKSGTKDRLNTIKNREPYRPVSPVCIEEDAHEFFEPCRPTAYMLEFQRVTSSQLRAVTHVDGSARLQTISQSQNPELYTLLQAFKRRTGVGVLCNTSLNFPGRGFINRSSDLFRFASERQLDGVVVNDRYFAFPRR